MKMIFSFIIIAVCCFFLLVCSINTEKHVNGIKYNYYGVLNTEEKNPNIKYKISKKNVVIGVILSETVIVPIYIVGFCLYEPISSESKI